MTISKPMRPLLLALLIGISANILFWSHWLGISVPIFTTLIIGALVYIIRQKQDRLLRQAVWLIIPIFFCATMIMLRSNELLTALNILTILYLLVLLAVFATADDLTRPGFIEYGVLPIRVAIQSVTQPAPIIKDALENHAPQAGSKAKIMPIIRGLVIALPFFLVFLALLLSADAIFAATLRNLFARKLDISLPFRLIFIIVVAWLSGGWLLYAVRPTADPQRPVPQVILQNIRKAIHVGITEAATVLISLNLLFGSFVLIQFAYLFGGLQHISLGDISYAEYARRGFGELVAVSVLTLGVILLFHWFTKRDTAGQSTLFNILSSIMVSFVVVMLISAFQRLTLYELRFGFTELRLFVHVFMIWLGVLLVWFAIALWIQPKRLAIGALAAGIGFIITLNLINPDVFIVRRNVERLDTHNFIDLNYLSTLSYDATAELIKLEQKLQAHDDNINTRNCSTIGYSSEISRSTFESFCIEAPISNFLPKHLDSEFRELVMEEQAWDWQAFHIGRWRAYQALKTGQDQSD